MEGGAGNDDLYGGGGNNTMEGGAGNDHYYVGGLGDIVVEAVDAGIDTVYTIISFSLPANVENLTLSGAALDGTGNELNNTITGNELNNSLSGLAGNDTLDGGLGNDTMSGGPGNDIYVVDSNGDVVSEAAGAGTDLVKAYLNYTLPVNVENLSLLGSALKGTGNGLDNCIVGNDNANTLSGLAGNDTLYGDDGNDSLLGGNGDDCLMGDNGNDLLEGGAGADVLYGGPGDDTLHGGDGNDELHGEGGADSMVGLTGNDQYYVDSEGDVVTEATDAGTDVVWSHVSFTLPNNVENLFFFSYAPAIIGTGNNLDNYIRGNNLNNILSGLAGNDRLVGDEGNDSLNGGDGQDLFLFNESGLSNYDTINDFSHGDDAIGLQDLLDGVFDSSLQGLTFTDGVLNADCYFEGPGFTGNGPGPAGIYNDTNTGKIYYNPTSFLSWDSVIICTVGAATASSLDNTDFVYSA